MGSPVRAAEGRCRQLGVAGCAHAHHFGSIIRPAMGQGARSVSHASWGMILRIASVTCGGHSAFSSKCDNPGEASLSRTEGRNALRSARKRRCGHAVTCARSLAQARPSSPVRNRRSNDAAART